MTLSQFYSPYGRSRDSRRDLSLQERCETGSASNGHSIRGHGPSDSLHAISAANNAFSMVARCRFMVSENDMNLRTEFAGAGFDDAVFLIIAITAPEIRYDMYPYAVPGNTRAKLRYLCS